MAYGSPTVDQVQYEMKLFRVVDEVTILSISVSAIPGTDDNTGEFFVPEADEAFQALADFLSTSDQFQVGMIYKRSSAVGTVTLTPPAE